MNRPSAMVRTRALERSSRVERSCRANALSFALLAPTGRGRRAPGGSRSTPKFFGRRRLSATTAASAAQFSGWKRIRAPFGVPLGPVGLSAIVSPHLRGRSGGGHGGRRVIGGEAERFERAAD